MKRIIVALGLVALAGCKPALTPEAVQSYQSRTLYTCCNLHYETADIDDVNYYAGTLIPLGSPAEVEAASRNSVTLAVGGTTLKLQQAYTREQESFQQFLDKVLVQQDPRQKLAAFPRAVQNAINEARVEKGMTREQVLMSLGYPPAHRTPALNAPSWTYWYNHWVTYQVTFDDAGLVSQVIGQPAPTRNEPIKPDAPTPAAPAQKKRRR